LFVAMPGLGQGYKRATRQRPVCASVPLTLKLSLLGIVVDLCKVRFSFMLAGNQPLLNYILTNGE